MREGVGDLDIVAERVALRVHVGDMVLEGDAPVENEAVGLGVTVGEGDWPSTR